MTYKSTTCYHCERELEPLSTSFQAHPEVADCEVKITDTWGICVEETDERLIAELAQAYHEDDGEPASPPERDDDLLVQIYPTVDQVLEEIFAARGLPRLGGASTGRGWSSIGLFQKCPYAWKRRYIEKAKPVLGVESPSLAIGSIVHTMLAVYYAKMMGSPYGEISPQDVYDQLLARANPEFAHQGWRLFQAYELWYKFEVIEPLLIEHDVRDPRTGESCRYDLVAYFPEEAPMRLPGTYIIEHKTASRFDNETLNGWPNDGEVLGEIMHWKQMGFDKRYGELRGVIVNIIGKQKEPKFHRTIVAPTSWQLEAHRRELAHWEGLIQLSTATGKFPRARRNCVDRYGMCEWFDHCITEE